MTQEELKRYPYFTSWLEELGRPLEGVEGIEIAAEIEETDPLDGWKMHKRTDNFTAKLTFTTGDVFERSGKFSDGTMTCIEAKESANEQTQEAPQAQ